MPIRPASRRACSSSPGERLGLLPVKATARPPRAECAALATTALSTPPENATPHAGERLQQGDEIVA